MTNLRDLKISGRGGLTLPAFSFSGGLSDLSLLTKLQVLVRYYSIRFLVI